MSLKLLKVELHNIRSHEHLVYTPGAEGVSVIQGANGTGKSTIIDSIAWAIYGTKPTGVSKNSFLIRDGVDVKKTGDKAYAVVDIAVDGQHLRIERRIMTKAGMSESDVWAVEPSVETVAASQAAVAAAHSAEGVNTDDVQQSDGEDSGENTVTTNEHGEQLLHLAGPSVSHVKNYLVKRLRMDEKGFLAAVMVQQKEVDSLISAPAAERGRVIEKLTGISALTQALEIATKDHNELKKHAANSSADEGAIATSKKELAKLQKDKAATEKRRDKLEEQFKEKRDTARTLRDTVQEQQEDYDRAQTLENEKAVEQERITAREGELESLNEDRQIKRDQLSSMPKGVGLQDIESDHADLSSRLREAQNGVDTSKKKAESARVRITELEELIGEHEPEAVSKLLAEKSLASKTFSDEERALQVSIDGREQDSKKTQKAVDVLLKGHGSCPTCLQEVDDVTDVVNSLEAQIAENTKKNEADRKKAAEFIEKVDKLYDETDNLSRIAEAFGNLHQSREDLKQHNEDHAKHGSDVKILEKEFKNSERKLYNARRHAETKQEYDRMLKRANTISDTIEASKKRMEEITTELQNLKPVTASQLQKRRDQLSKARDSLSDIRDNITEKRGEVDVAEARESSLTKDIERLEHELKRHKELLASVELAASSRKLVEDFRTARIESAIPVIEVYASDLLSSFTDGHFVGVELDAKFNMSVILADGTARPVGLLSGGELSAAAIALRLAVSMMLTGGSSSQLMILDEVLVSQDFGRAEQILSTIKDVSKGQVVLIAHSEIVESVADHTFDMQREVMDMAERVTTTDAAVSP